MVWVFCESVLMSRTISLPSATKQVLCEMNPFKQTVVGAWSIRRICGCNCINFNFMLNYKGISILASIYIRWTNVTPNWTTELDTEYFIPVKVGWLAVVFHCITSLRSFRYSGPADYIFSLISHEMPVFIVTGIKPFFTIMNRPGLMQVIG